MAWYDSCVAAKKLKFIEEELKKWGKEVIGDVKVKKYDVMGTISSFDLKEVGFISHEAAQKGRGRFV